MLLIKRLPVWPLADWLDSILKCNMMFMTPERRQAYWSLKNMRKTLAIDQLLPQVTQPVSPVMKGLKYEPADPF